MAAETMALTMVDPRSPEAAALIAAMTRELAGRYDYAEDGSGNFRPEDVLVPGAGFVVGRVAGQPMVCGAFRPMEPGVCEVKRMYVRRTARGTGVAQAIVARLEQEARAKGYRHLMLETGDTLFAAHRLYERAGFRRCEVFGPYRAMRPQQVERSWFFEKLID